MNGAVGNRQRLSQSRDLHALIVALTITIPCALAAYVFFEGRERATGVALLLVVTSILFLHGTVQGYYGKDVPRTENRWPVAVALLLMLLFAREPLLVVFLSFAFLSNFLWGYYGRDFLQAENTRTLAIVVLLVLLGMVRIRHQGADFLIASVAALGVGGLVGLAYAIPKWAARKSAIIDGILQRNVTMFKRNWKSYVAAGLVVVAILIFLGLGPFKEWFGGIIQHQAIAFFMGAMLGAILYSVIRLHHYEKRSGIRVIIER